MVNEGYLLGLDIGRSSVSASLISISSGQTVASAQAPSVEMVMVAKQPALEEQHPESWWAYDGVTTRASLRKSSAPPALVEAIGIACQMQGLPFGNGAERMSGNKEIGASIHGLDVNRQSSCTFIARPGRAQGDMPMLMKHTKACMVSEPKCQSAKSRMHPRRRMIDQRRYY